MLNLGIKHNFNRVQNQCYRIQYSISGDNKPLLIVGLTQVLNLTIVICVIENYQLHL